MEDINLSHPLPIFYSENKLKNCSLNSVKNVDHIFYRHTSDISSKESPPYRVINLKVSIASTQHKFVIFFALNLSFFIILL